MSSTLTNVESMAALQKRVGTGLRAEYAKDESSAWPVATGMRGDVAGFKAIAENLALATASISVARAGAEAAAGLLEQIKEKVVEATGAGVDTARLQHDVDRLIARVDGVVDAAGFNGINLLNGSTATVDLLAATGRSGGTSAVQTITANGADLTAAALAIATLDVTAATTLHDIEAAHATAVAGAAEFAAVQDRLEIQSDFVTALSGALGADVGSHGDADMEAEAARLGALQVQQQLGTQSLSIANSAPQSILALFR